MAFLDETGLTHLWGKITNKFLAKSNVANNLTTTSEGYALDARQGVALMNAISESSMKLVPEILINKKTTFGQQVGGDIDKTYTFEHNCILYIATDKKDYSDSGVDVYVYVADIEHQISESGDYQAFIPAGTTVRIKRTPQASRTSIGILATVLYIE